MRTKPQTQKRQKRRISACNIKPVDVGENGFTLAISSGWIAAEGKWKKTFNIELGWHQMGDVIDAIRKAWSEKRRRMVDLIEHNDSRVR